MRFKSAMKQLAAALALAGAAATAQAQFSGVVVVGDSYSDTGNYNWFSNSPTAQGIWAARISNFYGFAMSPAYPGYTGSHTSAPAATGNGFAIGGGQTKNVPGVKGSGTQISDLINRSGGHLDPNGLYLVFIGGNDVNAALNTIVGGNFSNAAIANAQGQMVAAATNVVTQVATLRAAGARNIVVLNLPNFAPLPITQGAAAQVQAGVTAVAGAAAGAQAAQLFLAMASVLPQTYDATLEAGLKDQGALTFDTAQFVANLYANPAAFGISNLNVPVCGGTGVNWNNCHGVPSNGALFADALHMSDAGHALLADWVLGALQGVSDGAGLANMAAAAPLGRSGAQWRTIETQLRAFGSTPQRGARLFVSGDYADGTSYDTAGNDAADGSTGSLVIGFENAISDATLIGGAIGRERGDFDLARGAGNLQFNESVLSLFFSHRMGANWFLSGAASHGTLDYDSRRNVAIGPMTAVERAEFSGKHDTARVQLAYVMRHGGHVHGPFVGYDWESVKVDGFSEGVSATAIQVGKQSVSQSHARIGYDVTSLVGIAGTSVRPFAQLSYAYQLDDAERSYAVGMGSTGSRLTLRQGTESGGFARLAVGATTQIGKAAALTFGVSATFDGPVGDDRAVTVALDWAL